MSTSTIAKHYTRILTLWPKDPLRPNLPFTRTIEKRSLPFGVQPLTPTDPSSPSSPPSSTSSSSRPPASAQTVTTTTPPSASTESPQINALYSLLENRYSKKYPLSEGVLRPKSNPEHYVRLMEEIERAPGKSWVRAKIDEWKLKIRWS
ncbi:hypothetical protein CC80DRAFT_548305 [Byssothecium circinans]|uniref:Uncharacterized protein n=1 Tax=Byssothecium circinans TaxID=147558 RepID=A0A6A5U6S1_9PLEO|nr:hypothetical protein CC80DRAFT_548305 [Byssothecium circinans]